MVGTILDEVSGNFSVSGRALFSLSGFSETGEVHRINRYPLPRRFVGRFACAGGTPDVAGVEAGAGGVDHDWYVLSASARHSWI
jgi:hypothetical protein